MRVSSEQILWRGPDQGAGGARRLRPYAATHQYDRHGFGRLAHHQGRGSSKFVRQTHNTHPQVSPEQIGATTQIQKCRNACGTERNPDRAPAPSSTEAIIDDHAKRTIVVSRETAAPSLG